RLKVAGCHFPPIRMFLRVWNSQQCGPGNPKSRLTAGRDREAEDKQLTIKHDPHGWPIETAGCAGLVGEEGCVSRPPEKRDIARLAGGGVLNRDGVVDERRAAVALAVAGGADERVAVEP